MGSFDAFDGLKKMFERWDGGLGDGGLGERK